MAVPTTRPDDHEHDDKQVQDEEHALDRPDFVAGIDERPQRRREWSGGLRSVVLPLLAVAAIVGAVWYFQRRGDEQSGDAGREQGVGIVSLPSGRNSTGQAPAAEPGRAAPDFILKRLGDGTPLRLSDLRGKTVLVNFWATWCGPCRQEMPELVQAYADNQARGLEIVSVDLQEPDDKVRDFVDEFGMRFPVVMDRNGEVATTYRAASTGLPTTVFIDKDGVIRTVKLGAMTHDYLQRQLAALLD